MHVTFNYRWKEESPMWALLKGATAGSLMYLGARELYQLVRRQVKSDRIYTQREVAHLLRVPEAEALALIESARIPGQYVGSEYRVMGASVIDFLNTRAPVQATPQAANA